jgi:endonuclease/exonuclease/phosphatase family metal-dependent hydrolase
MRRICASLALVFLLAAPAVTQDATGLTVVTINAWSGLTDSGVFARGEIEDDSARTIRLGMLAEDLAALEADIVTVGEANPVNAVAARLEAALGLQAVSHMAEGGVRIGPVGLPSNLREGDIVLAAEATEPSLAVRRTLAGGLVGRAVSFQTGETTHVVGVELSIGGQPLYVFQTRWHASPFATREDMVALVDAYRAGELDAQTYLERMRRTVEGAVRRLEEARRTVIAVNEAAGDAPVILTGTLNALPGSPEVAVLEKAGFVDAFAAAGRGPAATWDPARNPLIREQRADGDGPGPRRAARLDYIFVRGGIRVASAEVVLDTVGRDLSDHFGVLARIILPEGGTE